MHQCDCAPLHRCLGGRDVRLASGFSRWLSRARRRCRPSSSGIRQARGSRRTAATAAAAAAARRRSSPTIRRNVGFFTARGGTIGYLIEPAAVVVVDSQYPDTAKLCLDGLNERSKNRAIDLLINTHHHDDHTGGNIGLQTVAKKVLAHAKAAEHHEDRGPGAAPARTEQTLPDRDVHRRLARAGRRRVDRGEVLRRGAHERRRGRSRSSARTSCTWAT